MQMQSNKTCSKDKGRLLQGLAFLYCSSRRSKARCSQMQSFSSDYKINGDNVSQSVRGKHCLCVLFFSAAHK